MSRISLVTFKLPSKELHDVQRNGLRITIQDIYSAPLQRGDLFEVKGQIPGIGDVSIYCVVEYITTKNQAANHAAIQFKSLEGITEQELMSYSMTSAGHFRTTGKGLSNDDEIQVKKWLLYIRENRNVSSQKVMETVQQFKEQIRELYEENGLRVPQEILDEWC